MEYGGTSTNRGGYFRRNRTKLKAKPTADLRGADAPKQKDFVSLRQTLLDAAPAVAQGASTGAQIGYKVGGGVPSAVIGGVVGGVVGLVGGGIQSEQQQTMNFQQAIENYSLKQQQKETAKLRKRELSAQAKRNKERTGRGMPPQQIVQGVPDPIMGTSDVGGSQFANFMYGKYGQITG